MRRPEMQNMLTNPRPQIFFRNMKIDLSIDAESRIR